MPVISFIDGKSYSIAHFGAGSGKIWMDDVACSSSHTQLIYCPSSILGTNNCGHSEDAGVGCEGKFALVTLYIIPPV